MKEQDPKDFLESLPRPDVPKSLDRKIDELIGAHESARRESDRRTVPLWLFVVACVGFLWLGRVTSPAEQTGGVEIRHIERFVYLLDRPGSGARNIFDIQSTQDRFLSSPENIEVLISKSRQEE